MRKAKPKTAPTRRVLESFDEFGGDKQFATTLARGLEILRCFAPEGPMLGNKDLAERTGLPKPTVSRFTYTLSRLGYLQAPTTSRRNISSAPPCCRSAYPLLATMTLRQVARPRCASSPTTPADRCRWACATGSTSSTSRPAGRSVDASRQLSDIGLSQPIAATAIGRAYLAACTPAEREAILNEIRVKTPASTSATTRR